MLLTIRILHTDLTVVHTTAIAPRYRKATNALCSIGTRLRALDPSIAAVRADEIKNWTWMGHHTQAHLDAMASAERAGLRW